MKNTITLDETMLNKVAGETPRKREFFVSRILSISSGRRMCAHQTSAQGGKVNFVCA